MADKQLLAPLPPLTLKTGCIITVEAIHPTTGAAITGVTVSQVALYASNVTPGETFEEAYDSYLTHEPGD